MQVDEIAECLCACLVEPVSSGALRNAQKAMGAKRVVDSMVRIMFGRRLVVVEGDLLMIMDDDVVVVKTSRKTL